jgi:DUF1680 family protein
MGENDEQVEIRRFRDDALYQTRPFRLQAARMTAAPYYVWNNRGPNRMVVWLPEN